MSTVADPAPFHAALETMALTIRVAPPSPSRIEGMPPATLSTV